MDLAYTSSVVLKLPSLIKDGFDGGCQIEELMLFALIRRSYSKPCLNGSMNDYI
jgi:hypothetical protein